MGNLTFRLFGRPKAAFTMIEILVALMLLAFGLLGMAGMTVIVMKGGRGAQDLADATNICQQKIEELKDVQWLDLGESVSGDGNELSWGLQDEAMVQEVDLNPQGLTWVGLCKQQLAVTGSACSTASGETTSTCDSKTVNVNCKAFLDAAGPYKFTRTFNICSGVDYDSMTGDIPPGSGRGSAADPANFTYSAGPNCIADPADPATRPQTLACETNDILTPGTDPVSGTPSPEKMIKMLCTWRTSDGACHYVNFEALRMQ